MPQSVRARPDDEEYALILAAVALVVFVFYQTMGQSIESMVEWGTIHNDLLSS
jgi:Flp pilus assembly pilin Flp